MDLVLGPSGGRVSRLDRMRVRFIKDTHLPRFTLKAGEFWEKRADRFTDRGFPVGGGFAEKDRYVVISSRG